MITVIHTYLSNYNTATTDVSANNTRKKVIFENYALFLDCISKINNPEVENTKDIDVVIPMCNSYGIAIATQKHQEVYFHTRDKQALNNDNASADFDDNNTNDSFKF